MTAMEIFLWRPAQNYGILFGLLQISTIINQYVAHFPGQPQLLKVQRFIAIVFETLQKLAFTKRFLHFVLQ